MTAKFFVDTNVLVHAASNAPEDQAKRNAAGYAGNGPWFWRQMLEKHPEMFSEANKVLIRKEGLAPIIDATWVKYNRMHKDFMHQKLIHHHIDQGPIAKPLPESVHRGEVA